MSTKRFSKDKLIADLDAMAKRIQEEHGFRTTTGYSQVVGKGEEMNRAYAEWHKSRSIAESIESGFLGR